MSLDSAIQHLLKAKRISAPSQSYAKDNPGEWVKVKAYLEGGSRPTGVSTEMGLGLLEIEDERRAVGPPPPPTGTLYDSFSDFPGLQLVNQWLNDGTNAMQPYRATGTPWPSPVNGAGVREMQTPQGPGFQFVCDSQMDVSSGGKKSEIVTTILSVDVDQTITTRVFFPAGKNAQGFPPGFNAWNDLIDFHAAGIGMVFGVNTDAGFGPVPSFYFRAVGNGWDVHRGGPQIALDRWYTLRTEVRFSSGVNGYVRAYVDGQKFLDRSGPTIHAGQVPYLQFGFYGPAQLLNEVWFAGVTSE